MKRVTRQVKREKAVRQRRRRPSQAKRQSANLEYANLNLANRTYLTIPQLVNYIGLASRDAAYTWLWKQRAWVPKLKGGGPLLVRRRDVDVAVQTEQRPERSGHGGQQ